MINSITFLHIADIILKLVLAVLCAGLVGLIKHGHKDAMEFSVLSLAGFTSTLFALIFTKLNISLAANFNNLETGIATIIIGFALIGGSLIIAQKASYLSILDAFTIWTVAGMGVAIGAGLFIIGIISGVLMSLLLNIIHKITLTKIGSE